MLIHVGSHLLETTKARHRSYVYPTPQYTPHRPPVSARRSDSTTCAHLIGTCESGRPAKGKDKRDSSLAPFAALPSDRRLLASLPISPSDTRGKRGRVCSAVTMNQLGAAIWGRETGHVLAGKVGSAANEWAALAKGMGRDLL